MPKIILKNDFLQSLIPQQLNVSQCLLITPDKRHTEEKSHSKQMMFYCCFTMCYSEVPTQLRWSWWTWKSPSNRKKKLQGWMFLCLNLICILLFHWSVDVSEPENVPVCPKNIPQFWRCLYSQFFIICERNNCWICALSF